MSAIRDLTIEVLDRAKDAHVEQVISFRSDAPKRSSLAEDWDAAEANGGADLSLVGYGWPAAICAGMYALLGLLSTLLVGTLWPTISAVLVVAGMALHRALPERSAGWLGVALAGVGVVLIVVASFPLAEGLS